MTNEEKLLKRIKKLEDENEQLKKQLGIKKFKIIGTRHDGSSYESCKIERIVEGKDEQDVRETYGGYQLDFSYISIEEIIPVEEN